MYKQIEKFNNSDLPEGITFGEYPHNNPRYPTGYNTDYLNNINKYFIIKQPGQTIDKCEGANNIPKYIYSALNRIICSTTTPDLEGTRSTVNVVLQPDIREYSTNRRGVLSGNWVKGNETGIFNIGGNEMVCKAGNRMWISSKETNAGLVPSSGRTTIPQFNCYPEYQGCFAHINQDVNNTDLCDDQITQLRCDPGFNLVKREVWNPDTKKCEVRCIGKCYAQIDQDVCDPSICKYNTHPLNCIPGARPVVQSNGSVRCIREGSIPEGAKITYLSDCGAPDDNSNCDQDIIPETNPTPDWCIANNCKKCKVGGYGQDCEICEDGFKIKSTFGSGGEISYDCIPNNCTSPNCKDCSDNNYECISCNTGYKLNSNKQCDKAPCSEDKCELCSSTDKYKCVKCNTGYKLDSWFNIDQETETKCVKESYGGKRYSTLGVY